MTLTGWSTEEMTLKKPVALHVFWPSMDLNTTPKELARDKSKWKSLDDQSKDRQKKLKELYDFFEEAHAYAKSRPATGTVGRRRLQSRLAGDASLPESETPIVVHADSIQQIKASVNWAETNKYKMILAGGRDSWILADLLAKQNIPVVFESVWIIRFATVIPTTLY